MARTKRGVVAKNWRECAGELCQHYLGVFEKVVLLTLFIILEKQQREPCGFVVQICRWLLCRLRFEMF